MYSSVVLSCLQTWLYTLTYCLSVKPLFQLPNTDTIVKARLQGRVFPSPQSGRRRILALLASSIAHPVELFHLYSSSTLLLLHIDTTFSTQ